MFEGLAVQPGERIAGPLPVEIQSLIARIDHLTEQVRGSGGGLLLFHDLKRAVRRVEDGTLVLVWLGEF